MTIRIRHAGLLTTVQDLGRYGYVHLGLSPTGAADALSFRIANLLLGNPENAPALEMTVAGATLDFDARALVALAGAECECKLGAYAVPNRTAIEVPAGGTLTCGRMKDGARAYLAVAGGFQVPLVLGSASTHLAARMGGFKGRKLQPGDQLSVGKSHGWRSTRLSSAEFQFLQERGPIRITQGPQCDWFAPRTFATFLSAAYTVTDQADRAGLRLKGETINPARESQLLTDGIPLGAVQVPRGGQPIILFVDQQTTGGYPKIANVVAADLHRVAQLRPRDPVQFAEVSLVDAVSLLREQQERLRNLFPALT